MDHTIAYWLLLSVSFSLLMQQALSKSKTLAHYLFAIFCISLSMMCVQKLSADSLGLYQYVIGLATCATCNVMWLLSRAIFRKHDAVLKRHISVAVLIAMMIMLNQAWHFITELNIQSPLLTSAMAQFKIGLNESTKLLSSCILVLTFWEALRGYSTKNRLQKQQSLLFAGSFLFAVVNSSILSKVLTNEGNYHQIEPWFMASSALVVLFSVQLVFILQNRISISHGSKNQVVELSVEIDKGLVDGIIGLVQNERIFLQENVKILDFASRLTVPEYKISQVIRQYFNATNFNQFLNQYRVEHAKNLLTCRNKQSWSMLVIGLESGFGSAVSFNRVFKANTGQLPKQYRDSFVKPSAKTQPLEIEYS